MRRSKLYQSLSSIPRRGVMTLEWVLIVTVLVIGVVGGLGAVRNATLTEMQELSDVIDQFNVKTQAELTAEGMPASAS